MASEQTLQGQGGDSAAEERYVPDAILRSLTRTAVAVNILVVLLVIALVIAGLVAGLFALYVLETRNSNDVGTLAIAVVVSLFAHALPTFLLYRYRLSIRELLLYRREVELVLTLRAQLLLWRYCGIVLLLGIALFILVFAYRWLDQ